MHRCTLVPPVFLGGWLRFCPARLLLALSLVALGGVASLPASAQAQMLPKAGAGRNFPEAALRGTLVVTSQGMAEVNGKAIRMAPGMRLFNAESALVMLHTVIGQKLTVNYVIEPSTGWLLTAWVLSSAEAAQERKSNTVR